MSTATHFQVAGTHYMKMAIQPRQFYMPNRWDGDAANILRYLSRYKSKNGLEDLRKARHTVEMRSESSPPPPPCAPIIRMRDYVEQNGFGKTAPLKHALDLLWDSVYIHDGPRIYGPHLIRKIDELIAGYEDKGLT